MRTPALLSLATREKAGYAATMVMRMTGLDDVTGFGTEQVDQYLEMCGEAGRANAVHTLNNAHCLFRNLAAAGEIDEDPLADVEHQKTRVNSDYVPADQVAKLRDLQTLDLSDFDAVRDRMIVFVLLYDFPLRISEAATPAVSGVKMDGEGFALTFLGSKQGGNAREPVTQRNLFPESRTLMEAYLALRPETGSDALLVSPAGRRLGTGGVRGAVRRVCERLGIRTAEGGIPSAHRFRHSLGTLNVGELGMRLTPYYLMRRYRHRDIRTTMDVYVANNPLLDEAQHRAVVANGNGRAVEADPEPQAMASDIDVPEREAMAAVRQLGVSWRALRDHALGERAAVERGGRLFYSRRFLDGLCTEWMTRDEAIRLMGLGASSSFRYHVRNRGMTTLVIGRASLVRVEDVMRFIRRNGDVRDDG